MEWVYLVARLVHITCGSLALLAGPVAMLSSRTGRFHCAWGQLYLALVVALVLSGGVLLHRQPSLFSFGVAVLSLVTALSGYRVVQRRRCGSQLATWDGALLLGGAGTGAALAGWGVGLLSTDRAGGLVGCFIGGLILVTVVEEAVRVWHARRRPPCWQEWHMSRMVGSYLSVVTGFLVQAGAPLLVAVGLPASWLWLSWIMPLLVGVPLWAVWRARLRRSV